MAPETLRVLFSHDVFMAQHHGGASRLFAELHRTLTAQGVTSRVSGGWHRNVYLQGQPNVTGLRLPGGNASPAVRRAARLCNDPLEWAMAKLWRPSVYHLTYFPRRRYPVKVPIAVTVLDMIHELHPEQFPAHDRTSQRKRHWTNAADLVFAISERTKRDVVELFSIPAEKVAVVYPGVSSLAPDPSVDLRPYGDYLLYVGERSMPYKNFESLLVAVARSEVARKLDLVCFGGPPASDRERAGLAALGLDQIHFVRGPDAHLAAFYAGARALVYPSKYEGFGFPPVEAMAAGCPVACSTGGSVPEVVGDAGLLFDPDDVDQIAAVLDRIVADEDLRARLTAAGRRRAQSFTWERAGRETVDAYRRICVGSTAT